MNAACESRMCFCRSHWEISSEISKTSAHRSTEPGLFRSAKNMQFVYDKIMIT